MTILETDRLIFRRFRIADAEAMDAIFQDGEIMWIDGVWTPEAVRSWLRAYVDDYYHKWGFGMWAVVEKINGEVIGYCGLSRFPDRCPPTEAEIGYRLARAHWERGLATEAARAVRDYAFGTLSLPRIIAMIDPRNIASLRVAEKIGLRYEKDVMLEGYSHPDRLYALSRKQASAD